MNQLSYDYKLTYNPIPFFEYISRGPICTFFYSNSESTKTTITPEKSETITSIPSVSSISSISSVSMITSTKYKPKSKTKEKYSFTEYELTISVKDFHNYIKDWDSDKIKELSLARRRYKNRLYSRKSRLKRKNKLDTNDECGPKDITEIKEIEDIDDIQEIEVVNIEELPTLVHYNNIYI